MLCCFSTLYRVDAIEATSLCSIAPVSPCFSTLYRVDAIEAGFATCASNPTSVLSVPSIGSMLLKRLCQGGDGATAGLSVPSIGSMLLKRRSTVLVVIPMSPFSTLYRVDAIEARPTRPATTSPATFQYPLSGRCY